VAALPLKLAPVIALAARRAGLLLSILAARMALTG
jgi:hypothetical protein